MESFAKELLETLEADLEHAERIGQPMKRYYTCLDLTEASIKKLKAFIKKNPFPDQQVEILYFKTIAPAFYGKSIYYNKVLDYVAEIISSLPENISYHIDQGMSEIRDFFSKQHHFIWYMNMRIESLDHQFFIRGARSFKRDELAFIIDRDFCPDSYRLAQMIGYTAFRSYLEYEKERLTNPQPPVPPKIVGMKLAFTGTNADATELIKALVKQQVIIINSHPATAKQLAELFEWIFNRKLGNIDDIHNNNMQRKKDPTPFLNGLIRSLLKKNE